MKLAQRLLNDFWSSAGKITSHFVPKRPTLTGTYRAQPCPADTTIETGTRRRPTVLCLAKSSSSDYL